MANMCASGFIVPSPFIEPGSPMLHHALHAALGGNTVLYDERHYAMQPVGLQTWRGLSHKGHKPA